MDLEKLLTHQSEWVRNLIKEILKREISKKFEWSVWADPKNEYPIFCIRVNGKIFQILTNEFKVWRLEQVTLKEILEESYQRWLTPNQVIDWIEQRVW